jgi:hypothetical protein
MEFTRTLSHVYASSSGLLRPSRVSNSALARVPVARRAMRVSIRPSAVASFAAPNASSAPNAAPQKADTVMDVSIGYDLPLDAVSGPLVFLHFTIVSIAHLSLPLKFTADSLF